MKLLFQEQDKNYEIMVYDTAEWYGEKGNFRLLEFSDEAVQGVLDLNHPERILFEYPRAMIHLMEYNAPSFEDVFIIGHGIGTIANYFQEQRFKVAELNQTVVDVSRAYFGYSLDNVIIGDGRLILESEAAHAYDYILVDAFTDKGTPQHLISREFFSLTAAKLAPQGSLIMNLMGKGENDTLAKAIHTTLNDEYAYSKAFVLPGERVTDTQNIIIIASHKPVRFQARHMAGFTEIQLGQGHIILDNESWLHQS